MSRTMRLFTCFLLAVPIALDFTRLANAGKTPPSPPPTAPVEYHLVWLPQLGGVDSRPFAINDSAEIVAWAIDATGKKVAVRWNNNLEIEDLNLLNYDWFDAATGAGASGWTAEWCYDINNAGQIVGLATQGGQQRVFVLDREEGFILLPDVVGNSGYSSLKLNALGEVAGRTPSSFVFLWTPRYPANVYTLMTGTPTGFNSSQILVDTGSATVRYGFVIDGNGSISYGPQVAQTGMSTGGSAGQQLNDAGMFCGSATARKGDYAARYTDALGLQKIYDGSRDYVLGMNAEGDVTLLGNSDGEVLLYRNRENTTFAFYNLLDPASRAQLYANGQPVYMGYVGMTNNSNIGVLPTIDPFDHIVGWVYWQTSPTLKRAPFLLIPVPKL